MNLKWYGKERFEECFTYEWRPCTPPSTWADIVLFSNFSSPEYIIELEKKVNTEKTNLLNEYQHQS